jgi:predicted tellurium resistance membrane protein TerC
MKTMTTLEKKAICNLVLFLIGVKVTYSLVDHFVFGMAYPSLFIIICCLAGATYASLKREEYKKLQG